MTRKRILIENVGGYRQSAVLHSPKSDALRNWIKGGASKNFRNFWRLPLDSPLSSWSSGKWSASLIKVFFVNICSEMTEMWYYQSDDQILQNLVSRSCNRCTVSILLCTRTVNRARIVELNDFQFRAEWWSSTILVDTHISANSPRASSKHSSLWLRLHDLLGEFIFIGAKAQ